MELITTTVSVDAQKAADQVIIHLVQGDYGTRRLKFIPIEGGKLIDMSGINVHSVKFRAISSNMAPIEINCEFNNSSREIYMTPTQALVEYADEFSCMIILLDADNQSLSSMPFSLIVHKTIWNGDAVEHTNTTVTDVEYSDTYKELWVTLADGTQLIADMNHTHQAATAVEAGFMSPDQYAKLSDLDSRVNQNVRSDASPTFFNLTVGTVTIYEDGTILGLKFT